jgi:hypothetical protein
MATTAKKVPKIPGHHRRQGDLPPEYLRDKGTKCSRSLSLLLCLQEGFQDFPPPLAGRPGLSVHS